MTRILIAITLITIISSCSHKWIEITSEYIINENWNKKNENAWANSITIQKIKEGESYNGKKIYFDRYNGFSWGSKSRNNSGDTTPTIGNLKKINWYRFS